MQRKDWSLDRLHISSCHYCPSPVDFQVPRKSACAGSEASVVLDGTEHG